MCNLTCDRFVIVHIDAHPIIGELKSSVTILDFLTYLCLKLIMNTSPFLRGALICFFLGGSKVFQKRLFKPGF